MRLRLFFFSGFLLLIFLRLLYTGQIIYLWLLSILLAFLLFSALNLIFTFIFMRPEQSLSPDFIQRGDPAVLKILIRNRTPLPFAHITLHFKTLNNLLTGGISTAIISAPSFSAPTLSLPLSCPYSGCFYIGITALYISDILGLVRIKVSKLPAILKLIVLPTPGTSTLTLPPHNSGSSADLTAKRGDEQSSVALIRDYRPGDPLKHIHWKLSARTGKLLVKEFESISAPSALILLDLSSHPFRNSDAIRLHDCIIQSAAASVMRLLSLSARITMVCYCRHQISGTPLPKLRRSVISGDSTADFPIFRRQLADITFNCELPFTEILNSELSVNASGGDIIIVSHSSTAPQLLTALSSIAAADRHITLDLVRFDHSNSAVPHNLPELTVNLISPYNQAEAE